MKYIFMLIAILLSVMNACILKKYGEINKKNYSPFLFNAGVSIVWIIILFTLFLFVDSRISLGAIVYGVVYGVILFAFLLFKTQSMANGPVSLSTLIGSCAFVIATGFGVFYANEKVSTIQLIGMLMLLISLIMCVNPQRSGEKLTGKWFFYCFGFFLAGGLVGVLYKLFGNSPFSFDVEIMLLTAAIVSSLLFSIVGIVQAKSFSKIKPDKTILIFMLLSGIASCLYIRMNLSLSNIIPSIVFFPVSNGGMVILSTVIGRIVFKEKLNTLQLCGIAIGCIAVVITGCGDYLYNIFF